MQKTVNLLKVLVLLHKCDVPTNGSFIPSLSQPQALYLHFSFLCHTPVFLSEILFDNFAFRNRKFLHCSLVQFSKKPTSSVMLFHTLG